MPPGGSARAPVRPLALVALFVTGIVAGAGFGAATNAINGTVSPGYFITIMRWHTVSNIQLAAVAQGILEGILFGLFFSIILTATVGVSSKVRAPYLFSALHLAGVVLAVFACWLIGGVLAMALAGLSPEFYRATFRGVPEDHGAMMSYAWVGGSIWGAQFGGLACVILGAVLFPVRWRKRQSAQP